jgi:hypothetical protein
MELTKMEKQNADYCNAMRTYLIQRLRGEGRARVFDKLAQAIDDVIAEADEVKEDV